MAWRGCAGCLLKVTFSGISRKCVEVRSEKLICFKVQSCKFAFGERVPRFSGPFRLPGTIWELPHRRKRAMSMIDARSMHGVSFLFLFCYAVESTKEKLFMCRLLD